MSEESVSIPPPRPPSPHPDALARIPTWVYDPSTVYRTRGFSTATLFVYPRLLIVQPRRLPVWWGRVQGATYSAPAIVVQRKVWSYRAGFPGQATILLDYAGKLGSAWVPFGMRHRIGPLLSSAGFDVVESVERGWDTPVPLRLSDHPELVGRVPNSLLVE